jgi:antitoxin HicB
MIDTPNYLRTGSDGFGKDENPAGTRGMTVKQGIAFQVQKMMREQNISKSEMSRRMKTSRAALDRLLDPGNQAVTLQTLDRAARALGKRLQISIC